MMQREGERLAYLQALGITQYVPLSPIAGVLELPLLEWDTVAADEALSPQADVVAEQAAATAVSVAEVLRKVEITAEIATPDVVTPPVPPATELAPANNTDIPRLDLSKVKPDETPRRKVATKPATLQRFSLAVITLPQRARLLVELSHSDAPGLSALEFRMLSDIFLAMNIKQEINDSSTKLFRWPLVNNPRIASDASAARDGLQAFLAAAQAEQAVEKILFLGASPLQCFPHYTLGEVFVLPELNTAAGNATGLFTHSIAAQNNDWTLKSVVWRHLQAFL